MTRLVDEIMWEAPHDPWSDPGDGSWSATAHDTSDAGSELPPPPPYGYRYEDGVGYHPYVSDPGRRSLWRIYFSRLYAKWVLPTTAAHALHARHSASLRRQRLLVGIGVAAVVAILAAVLGATTPWSGPGGSGATRVQSTSATKSQPPATTPRSTSSGASGSGSQGSTTQPAPSTPPVTLAPGLFSGPPTSPGSTTVAPRPASAATRPASGGTRSSTGPATTASTPPSAASSATTPAPTSPTTPAPTNVTSPVSLSPDAQWWASNANQVTQMQNDASTIEKALPTVIASGNLSQVSQSCQVFQGEVTAAQALPVIPDTTLYPTWQSGLADYQNASQECIQGTAAQDPNLIGQAELDLLGGSAQVGQVTQGL